MLFTKDRKPLPKAYARISCIPPWGIKAVAVAYLCFLVSCHDLPDAQRTGSVNARIRVAVFDTLLIYPDTGVIDFGKVLPDTAWQDTLLELTNGTQVTLQYRWAPGQADTLMRYIRVDSGFRTYSHVRNDTVIHETTLFLPGQRIDTLKFWNSLLEVRAKYGNTEKAMEIAQRHLYLGTRRMVPGTLYPPELPVFRTSWNNRWLIFTLNLNGKDNALTPIYGLLVADLNNGSLSVLRTSTAVSPSTLVPATDPSGAWLHTGLAVWADPSHPQPVPSWMAISQPDACWTSDTSYILFVPATTPYAAYFRIDGTTWALDDSVVCPLLECADWSLCPDYNNDRLWIRTETETLVGFGFQKTTDPISVLMKGVEKSSWDHLMLPLLAFPGAQETPLRLDIRGKVAYFVSDK